MRSVPDEVPSPATSRVSAAPQGRSLMWRLIVPTCLAVMMLVCGIALYAPHEVVETAVGEALVRGEQTARQLQTLRAFYSEHAVAPATKAGAPASPNYKTDGKSIPVPTTFILDVAEAFKDNGLIVRLVSPYPWPTREGRVLDAFETEAWEKSWGRPLKVDRQTIVAVVAALREWLDTDHEARLAGYERRLQAFASELEGAPGVKLRMVKDEGPSPRVLRLDACIHSSASRATRNWAPTWWPSAPSISAR